MKHISTFTNFINESELPSDLTAGLNQLCQSIVRSVNITVNGVDSNTTLTARWVPGDKAKNDKEWRVEFSCRLNKFYHERLTAVLGIDWDYYLVGEMGETGTVTHYGTVNLELNPKQWQSSVYPRINSFSVDQTFNITSYDADDWYEHHDGISGEGDFAVRQFSDREQYNDSYPQIIADHLVYDFLSANEYFLRILPNL